jgi:hypothetical protein
VDATKRVAQGRGRRVLGALLPYRTRRTRRVPSRTTTWWAFSMYVVVLAMGSAIFGLMLAVFMGRADATDGYPIPTLASIIPALAALLLVMLQAYDLVQVARYKQPMQILTPMRPPLNDLWWAAITLAILTVGFVAGTVFWG